MDIFALFHSLLSPMAIIQFSNSLALCRFFPELLSRFVYFCATVF